MIKVIPFIWFLKLKNGPYRANVKKCVINRLAWWGAAVFPVEILVLQ